MFITDSAVWYEMHHEFERAAMETNKPARKIVDEMLGFYAMVEFCRDCDMSYIAL